MGLAKFQHALSRNARNEQPGQFIFADTETTPQAIGNNELQHNLRLGVALYWRKRPDRGDDTLEWLDFTAANTFWDWLESKAYPKQKLYVIAHNIQFDAGVLSCFGTLEERGWSITKVIIDARRNIWRFRKDNRSLCFLDNMNYFNVSLATLGDSIGIAKLPMPDKKAPPSIWIKYCRRDVEVMYKAWQYWLDFLLDNDLGNFGCTLAGQAFNAYRHRFMSRQIYIHASSKATRIERQAYKGGRVECFRIGEFTGQNIYLLDVNSMYPYIMSKYEYPCNLVGTGGEVTLRKLKNMLQTYCVTARAKISTPEPVFGIKYKGRLIFPIGSFEATLTTEELKLGLERGYIKGVKEYAAYDKGNLFETYVDFFYGQRQAFTDEGNIAYAYLCKIMLNSLYGKFGQKAETWEYVCDDPLLAYGYQTVINAQTHIITTYRWLNHQVETKTGFTEGFNSLVAIPAEITANSRLYLWQLIKDAGIDNVYYCDTDSLIVNDAGRARLEPCLNSTELGLLKIQNSTSELVLHNVKDYVFGGKVKIKGISSKAQPFGKASYRQYQSIGIKGGLHRGDINKAIWRSTEKTLERIYFKGVIVHGDTVKPLIFGHNDEGNYLDETALFETYGWMATYANQYLDELTYGALKVKIKHNRRIDDLSPADRSAYLSALADKRQEFNELKRSWVS